MGDNSIFDKSELRFYIVVFASLTIIIGFIDIKLALLALAVFLYLSYYSYNKIEEKNRQLTNYIENLSDQFESATKYAIFNMPFPLLMIDDKGIINWYNTPFIDLILEEDILNKDIRDIIEGIDLEGILAYEDSGKAIELNYNNKEYLIYSNYIKNKKSVSSDRKIILLYWVDNTKYAQLLEEYDNNKSVVSLVYVDNYDDVKSNTLDVNRPLVLAEIDRRIRNYFIQYNGLVRKYEKNKYLVVMDNYSLRQFKENKFDILDEMRELDIGNKIPITLSLGISSSEEGLNEAQKNASAAIDIALGRGGDQAVVNHKGNLDFYGGKSKAMEKRNKVKARVIGYALKQLISQSDRVFIMGHTNADMDAFGSALGVLRGVRNVGKDGYIVLNDINPSIKNIYERLKKVQGELEESIISTSKAKELISSESLMILVDNHKPSFTEAPELLDLVDKIVIIDHHRRGAEFVEDPVLTYLEPYASSASELVTEILSYMSDDIGLSKFEAEALLAGITVDTKNFSFQTGVRTFEAASMLKRAGADTTAVRQLFRDDYEVSLYKADVVSSSKIINDNIAIGKLDIKSEDAVLIAAQSANDLLDINDMEASFVLTHVDDRIHISARSLGNISVQLIVEKLGGGGHLTSAGVQMSDVSIEEAEKKLEEVIKNYIEEGGL